MQAGSVPFSQLLHCLSVTVGMLFSTVYSNPECSLPCFLVFVVCIHGTNHSGLIVCVLVGTVWSMFLSKPHTKFAVKLNMYGKMNNYMLGSVSESPGLLALLSLPSGKLKQPIQIAPPTPQMVLYLCCHCIC